MNQTYNYGETKFREWVESKNFNILEYCDHQDSDGKIKAEEFLVNFISASRKHSIQILLKEKNMQLRKKIGNSNSGWNKIEIQL